MNKYFKSLAVFGSLMCALSCQKKDNTPVDLSKVIVKFVDPTDGQVFRTGDAIQVNTVVSYSGELAGMAVQIIDTATDSILFEDDQDTHTSVFSFSRSWVDTCTKPTVLQVKMLVFVANNTAVPAERSIYIKSE